MNAYSDMFTLPVHAYVKSLHGDVDGTAGIVDHLVFQSVEELGFECSSVNISVDVDAFVPNISCEIATVTPRLSYANDFAFRLDTATCSVGAENQTRIWVWDCGGKKCSDEREYVFTGVDCTKQGSFRNQSILDDDKSKDLRWAMLVSKLSPLNLTYSSNASARYDRTLNRDDKPINVSTASRTAAVICKTEYSMNRATLQQLSDSGEILLRQLDPIPKVTGFTGTMLGELIALAISGSESFDIPNDTLASPLWGILSETLDGEKSRTRLLSAETLQRVASQAWTGMAAYLVRQNFLRPANMQVMGTATAAEDRLIVGAASLWIMVVGLLLAAFFTTCVMFTTPANALLRDPGLMSTDTIVLSSSPSFCALPKRCGSMRSSTIATMLRSARYSIDKSYTFSITVLQGEDHGDPETPKAKSRDWIPLSARHAMIFVTLAVPAVTIATLEALFRISERNNGFMDVSGAEERASYLSRYSVALVSLLIATCFSSLDFAAASFAPYTSLRLGSVPASRGIDLDLLGALPPIALSRSIRSRHASSFCSNIAGTIGSVLTVVASGLLVVNREAVIEQGVAASLSSKWDIAWPNSSRSGNGGAGVMFDRLQRGSMDLPTRIWNGIVLPQVASVVSLAIDGFTPAPRQSSPTSNYTFQVDGLRPLLSCEIVGDEYISFEYHFGIYKGSMAVGVSVSAPLPPSYPQGVVNGSAGYYRFGIGATFSPSDNSTYWGGFADLHHGPWASDSNYSSELDYKLSPFGEGSGSPEADNPAGCPSIGVRGYISRRC